MELKYILLIVVVILVAAYFLRPSPSSYAKPSAQITLYGSPTCGWCKKQLAEIDGMNIPYVDCSENKETCTGLGITAYPTFVLADGSQIKGFQSKDKIEAIINAPNGQ